MSNFDDKYTEYKKKLLKSYTFKEKIISKYKNTVNNEKSYIEHKGIFPIVFFLGALAGFSLSIYWSGSSSLISKIIFVFIFILCFFFSWFFTSKFKSNSAKSTYYSYVNEELIKSFAEADEDEERKEMIKSIKEKAERISYDAKALEKSLSDSSVKNKELINSIVIFTQKTKDDIADLESSTNFYSSVANELTDDYEVSVFIDEAINKK